MDLMEIMKEIAGCIHLSQDSDQLWGLMNMVMKFRVS